MSEATALPPTVVQIRESLLGRARSFVERHRTSFSAIGVAAVNDSKFLRRVEQGEGFNVTTYQRVLDWMDAADIDAGSGSASRDEYASLSGCRPVPSPAASAHEGSR